MNALAIVSLVLWVVCSVWFFDWRRDVVYPKPPTGLRMTVSAFELSAAALAIWVLAS